MKSLFYILLLFITLICGCSDYDAKNPDTLANKNAFKRQFKIKANSNATNIFFYADEFIQDPAYYYSFKTSPAIIKHLVDLFSLKQNNEDKNHDFKDLPFPWWNNELKLKSEFYTREDTKKEVIYLLWYDPKTQTCQFSEWNW